MRNGFHSAVALCVCSVAALAWSALSSAGPVLQPTANFGPYNENFLEGGIGVVRPLSEQAEPIRSAAPWSMVGWLRSKQHQSGEVIVAAVGDCGSTTGEGGGATGAAGARADGVAGAGWRGITLTNGILAFVLGPTAIVRNAVVLEPDRWYAVAAVFDGKSAHLYLDGREIAAQAASTAAVGPRIELAPAAATLGGRAHFGGSLAQWTLIPAALDPAAVATLAHARPNFSLVTFNSVGVGWPWQEHAWRGLQEPQDPWTLPHSHSLPSVPVALPAAALKDLEPRGTGLWALASWRLTAAPGVAAGGLELSQPDYDDSHWYAAVVPGTVLTTLIARGVYPDPDYGLNNLAIPDSLSRQDYWYRSQFLAPAALQGKELALTFKGINYAAEVWLNGERLGTVKGAFIRGVFNVTGKLRPGRSNALAVRISPPPHPGIPHEQSIAAGPGENGGNMAIDGPTFIASEGWDWIPGIRDRNTGIWQDVELTATGKLRLLDPQVIAHLPLPRTDSADLSVVVAVENRATTAVQATLVASFDSISVRKSVTLDPGISKVRLDAREFPQLHLAAPRLWWPNGYGPANLYRLKLEALADDAPSDSIELKFGVREITYELSLFDGQGRLRRVEVDPTLGSALGDRLVDVRHEAIKRTPEGWAESLTPAGENSPAVRPIEGESLTPYLTIRVNGVRIAARGGSWGMDDSRKRISRSHLEPFFRLHRAANLNIIRNWLGQNTEEVFYDLADEYGMLVLNDFWVSTQDFQVEPQDPQLFLANARDVISRYRNHASIAVWFGRNEGVPQPIINQGLADLTATLDGTRYYTGSSNSVNLQGSGPYNYRPPEQYFTHLAQGFSVEVGTPSLSTLESLRASIPEADRWPLSDTYAYHDWHFGGNGDVATFMAALAEQYGEASSLEDFERKAQLMDYVSYRAIFEGFQAHLWTKNSGRLLWMTHPSWPSNTWQIYSSDYDTAAAYYAVKKACEPLHAQLNLPDFAPAIANITRAAQPNLSLRTRIVSLDNRLLAERVDPVNVGANSVQTLAPLNLEPLLAQEALVIVKLTLTDSQGTTLSDNVYWQGRDAASQRRLLDLPPQAVAVTAYARQVGEETHVDVLLTNRGRAPALAAKITMLDPRGARVLPVYYADNYVAVLPGESRHIDVSCPAGAARCVRVALRGWNIEAREAVVEAAAPISKGH
jgi:Exo-beta-D-glucosaminidase Ig-fold domain/Glycosyl hydrolases family 2/Concanavalin A-like lectin/glucanases superfamily/Glycosyl hydrolases family 2, sugar binding domain/Glycosyl hydrolases family 2, TIM barrel domain